MKKIYTLLLILCFHSYFCKAQEEDGNSRVESIKMAYITRELNLSTDEAQRFWPIYNDYQNELKDARNKYPNDEVGFEQRVVEIKKKYQGNFKKVLGNDDNRTNRLYNTDKNYNGLLRKELENRHNQKNPQQRVPDQQQQPVDNQQRPVNNSKVNQQDNPKFSQNDNPKVNQQRNPRLNQQKARPQQQQQNTPVRRRPNNQRN